MNELKEQLAYNKGRLDLLTELYNYLWIWSEHGAKENINAVDLLNNFIGAKTDLTQQEIDKIQMLIPTKN